MENIQEHTRPNQAYELCFASKVSVSQSNLLRVSGERLLKSDQEPRTATT